MYLLKVFFRIVVAYLLIGVFLYLFQDILVFPRISDKYLSSDSNYKTLPAGITQSFVTTPDAEKLDLWTNYNPADYQPDQKPEQVAIIFHGNGETVESGNFLPFFKKQGISAFIFDYRGYGKSSGWPSEQGLYTDAKAVYEHVQKLTGVDSSRFILLGNSIGSGFAAYLAKEIDSKALILIAPYYTFKELILDRAVYAPFVFFLRYQIPTIEYIKQLKSTCLILAHGKKDNVIPFSHSERIMESSTASEKKVFLRSESAGHNDVFFALEQELEDELQKCLKFNH